MNWDEMAVVGRIARPHGIRGQVIVNLETDFPHERFQQGAELFIKRGGQVDAVVVDAVRFHRERPVIALRGVEDMNAAVALRGAELRVPIERLAALPRGTYYRHDLVGCRVETQSGETIGEVADVEGSTGGSRLVVATEKGEVLVPLVETICVVIDPGAKRIVIDPPEGLLELNAG
ncbi:MAG TPA: ribosome maturation factor RimM [Vicinamibacterales bacterium]|nr:ribosome maturation factor RimM [Vicinamibacterales bacterium]